MVGWWSYMETNLTHYFEMAVCVRARVRACVGGCKSWGESLQCKSQQSLRLTLEHRHTHTHTMIATLCTAFDVNYETLLHPHPKFSNDWSLQSVAPMLTVLTWCRRLFHAICWLACHEMSRVFLCSHHLVLRSTSQCESWQFSWFLASHNQHANSVLLCLSPMLDFPWQYLPLLDDAA